MKWEFSCAAIASLSLAISTTQTEAGLREDCQISAGYTPGSGKTATPGQEKTFAACMCRGVASGRGGEDSRRKYSGAACGHGKSMLPAR